MNMISQGPVVRITCYFYVALSVMWEFTWLVKKVKRICEHVALFENS